MSTLSGEERSAVVTGCGQGIGRAILERLRDDGYYVVGIEQVEALADDARKALGGRGAVVLGDVADRALLEEASRQAVAVAGLGAWVNNAAIMPATNLHAPVAEDVDRVLAVNLLGCYWGCSVAVRAFLGQRSPGAIVSISSVHGRAAYSNAAAYDISKAGVDALTRYVATEYGPVGIRANAIAPGGVRTPLFERFVAESADPERVEHEAARAHPLQRIAEAHEIAAVASFLLSSEASFVSGQSLAVDGGLTARCISFELDPTIRAFFDEP